MVVATDPYVCPVCGDRSAFESSCIRCDEPLVDSREVAPWQLSQTGIWRWKHWSASVISALYLLALVALYIAALAGSVWWLGGLGPLAGLVGFAAGVFLVIRLFAKLDANREALVGRTMMRAVSATKVSEVPDGRRVRVAGSTKTIRRAVSSNGPASLAFEETRRVGSGETAYFRQRVGGGEFVLDDGSGTVAIVRCEYVKIVGGVRVGERLIVPDGARLEVVGNARWDVADDEVTVSHARSAARVVRIEGTADEPVLLRVIEAPTDTTREASLKKQASVTHERDAGAARTGVRVDALDGSPAPAGRGDDELEVDHPARASDDRAAR